MSITISLEHSPTQTITSHGWVTLQPFEYEREKPTLSWVLNLPKAGPSIIHAIVDECDNSIAVDSSDLNSEIDTTFKH